MYSLEVTASLEQCQRVSQPWGRAGVSPSGQNPSSINNLLCGRRGLSCPFWSFMARPSPLGKHCCVSPLPAAPL